MAYNYIWNQIEKKKFRVITRYKDLLAPELTNFMKSRPKYSAFGPFYEMYLYAFALGFHSKKRKSLDNEKLDTFNAVYEWKDDYSTKKKRHT